MININTDTIIVGGGLAGLYTALNIDSKYRIDILLKEEMQITNSNLAQGGIAAELNVIKENITKIFKTVFVCNIVWFYFVITSI
jgi:L-aspartate oxidase